MQPVAGTIGTAVLDKSAMNIKGGDKEGNAAFSVQYRIRNFNFTDMPASMQTSF